MYGNHAGYFGWVISAIASTSDSLLRSDQLTLAAVLYGSEELPVHWTLLREGSEPMATRNETLGSDVTNATKVQSDMEFI
jgi:hypothetical protein